MKAFLLVCAILLFGGFFALIYTLHQYFDSEEQAASPLPEEVVLSGSNETMPASRSSEVFEEERAGSYTTEPTGSREAPRAQPAASKLFDQTKLEANLRPNAVPDSNEILLLDGKDVEEFEPQFNNKSKNPGTVRWEF